MLECFSGFMALMLSKNPQLPHPKGLDVKLRDYMDAEYALKYFNAVELTNGVFDVLSFELLDDKDFKKVAYFVTKTGTFKTRSRAIINSLFGSVGLMLTHLFNLGAASVQVEFIPRKVQKGGISLAIKVF